MKNKLILLTILFLGLLYIIAIGADFIAPYKYDEQHRDLTYQKPCIGKIDFFVKGYEYKFLFIRTNFHLFGSRDNVFLLGTDKHGRDIFSRLIIASRISLSIGLIGVAITFVLGMAIGGFAGYLGGKIDGFIMRLCEIIMCFPFFYLMLALRAVLPVELSSTQVYICIVLIFSLLGWPGLARVIRGMVLSIKEQDYIVSAKILGIRHTRLIWRHILPNTMSYALTSAFITIPAYILGEAGLSFLGLGIQNQVGVICLQRQ